MSRRGARQCRRRTTTQLQCKSSSVNAASNNNNKCVVSRVLVRAWQLLPVLTVCCCMTHRHGAVPLSCSVLSTKKKGAPAPTSVKTANNKTGRPPLPCHGASMSSQCRQPAFCNSVHCLPAVHTLSLIMRLRACSRPAAARSSLRLPVAA